MSTIGRYDTQYGIQQRMLSSDVNLKNARPAKPLSPSDPPTSARWTRTEAGQRESIRIEGMKIAQTAMQSIGLDTRGPWGPPLSHPQYALAVSLIFTKATHQTIMLNTPPDHVRSTSILWSFLAHDKRFEQVPTNEAALGDIIIGSGWQQGADGYAGIVVDHGRIVSNSNQGVQNNSSVLDIQRSHPGMTAFRYIGFWNFYRSRPFANAGFDPDEPRLPAGQLGGGQWTSGMVPSKTVLSGGNTRTTAQEAPATQNTNPPPGKPTKERAAEAKKFADLAEVYSERAKDEDRLAGTAVLPDPRLKPDEQERHKLAAKEAGDIAEEMKRRAYILTNGTADNYRKLVIDQYGINNPNLNEIMAYYAKKFNDQATLNYLKLQHPAVPPTAEQIRQNVAWMALFPQFEKMSEEAGEAPLTEPPEKSIFSKTTDIADGKAGSTKKNSAASGNPAQPDYSAVKWVPEASTLMKEGPAAYQAGVPGSRHGLAPQLSAVDSGGTVTAKFDGVNASTGEMVDGKLGLGGDSPSLALRQSATAAANGFGVRWEVPNAPVQAAAQRLLSKLGIKNIRVVVRPK